MDATRLEGLATLADEIDGQAPPSPEELAQQRAEEAAAAAVAEADNQAEAEARQWGAIAYMIGGALAMVAPELRTVYTEPNCLQWGRAVVPVSRKYGWNGPSALPELSLAIATLGLAVPSVLAVRHAIEQERASGWVGKLRAWWIKRRGARQADQAGAPEAEGAPDGR